MCECRCTIDRYKISVTEDNLSQYFLSVHYAVLRITKQRFVYQLINSKYVRVI